MFLCLLSLSCVTAGCCSMVQSPRALPLSLHTPFESALSWSFHRPSAFSASGEWCLRLNWTGELLLAEWNFSPTGLWRLGVGVRRWIRDWGGQWGKLLTKRLSLVQDKLMESHWDEAKTQVIGERAKAQMRAPLLQPLKSGSFTDVEGSCFSSKMRESHEIEVYLTLTESLSPWVYIWTWREEKSGKQSEI